MKAYRTTRVAAAVLLSAALSIFAPGLLAQVAPDPTEMGPNKTTNAEYQFPAERDDEILSVRDVELWARVYRPQDLSAGPYPLLVFLHGNHATCGRGMNPRIDDNSQYTTFGTCPPGYVPVPSHDGYGYAAERLASWGYIVVSINVNRGINAGAGVAGDSGLNLARGRMVLRHLQRLNEWNTVGGTPKSLGVDLLGQLDFNNVGLMGHSRGGEGMRAAYNQHRDPGSPWPDRIGPATFRGIFEIGAVDGQTSRVLNADGTQWIQLLPMCDGDVSNLQGIRPFDRMMRILDEDPATLKSNWTVWGTNHNFYNTEWQVSDSSNCLDHPRLFPSIIGSPEQQQVGRAGLMAFFRGNVGVYADPAFLQNFNPQFALPDVVTSLTRVDRGYTDSPNSLVTTVFEDFDQPTGTSSYGIPNESSNINIVHGLVPRHDPVQRAGVITWAVASSETYFQTNWMAEGAGRDISLYRTLDLRVSRQIPGLNPLATTEFSIRLAHDDGTLSDPVPLTRYTDLVGPVGGPGGRHPILQTARIPLLDFASADLTRIRGARLTFEGTEAGAIYVANLRLSTLTGLAGSVKQPVAASKAGSNPTEDPEPAVYNGAIRSLRAVDSSSLLGGRAAVEIELTSEQNFPVRDELAILSIGDRRFELSRYPDNGDTGTLIFLLDAEEFAQLAGGEPVTLQYGREAAPERWEFGRLDKSRLAR